MGNAGTSGPSDGDLKLAVGQGDDPEPPQQDTFAAGLLLTVGRNEVVLLELPLGGQVARSEEGFETDSLEPAIRRDLARAAMMTCFRLMRLLGEGFSDRVSRGLLRPFKNTASVSNHSSRGMYPSAQN